MFVKSWIELIYTYTLGLHYFAELLIALNTEL